MELTSPDALEMVSCIHHSGKYLLELINEVLDISRIESGRIIVALRAVALDELEQIVSESPKFLEAHVTLSTLYYRLKRKTDGNREREIVQTLTAERQAEQPAARLGADGKPNPVPANQ